MFNSRALRTIILVFAALLLLNVAFFYSPTVPALTISGTSKNAFVVFLAANSNSKRDNKRGLFDQEDHYFTGTRMLIYQLLHCAETRTNSFVPFVVMVTKEVSEENRQQLRKDGAQVIEVAPVKFDWIKPRQERWAQVMDKLRIFELTQFDKVLLLDTDIVVTKRLDSIFDDPAAQLSHNKQNPNKIYSDESPQPATYIMAGNSGPSQADHPYPSERGNRLNAGFVLLKPSKEMFEHYLSVGATEGKFPGGSPEQDLWNYVHNREGNMPWKQVDPDWTINSPSFNDYQHGIATFHEKYWKKYSGQKMSDVLRKSRWRMEGFFNGYHEI